MNLVLTRVDNRLIHGQILESWVPYVQADCILVANDRIAGNPLKKMMMQSAVPSRMRVEIGTIAEIARLFQSGVLNHCRTLVLFGTTADALRAYRAGLLFSKLNLGNLHAAKGKEQMSCTVFLDTADVQDLEQLEQAGITITARCIPADLERSWRKLIAGHGEMLS